MHSLIFVPQVSLKNMGIYFENTTEAEDAQYILKGIAKGEITSDFYLVQTDDLADDNLLWISNDDPRQHLVHRDYKDTVVIYNTKGKLTEKGCSYIRGCLLQEKRLATTLG